MVTIQPDEAIDSEKYIISGVYLWLIKILKSTADGRK